MFSNQAETPTVGVTATSPQHLGDALGMTNVVGDGETLLGGGRLGKGTDTVGEVLAWPTAPCSGREPSLCLQRQERVRTFSKAASFLPALLICSSAMSLI